SGCGRRPITLTAAATMAISRVLLPHAASSIRSRSSAWGPYPYPTFPRFGNAEIAALPFGSNVARSTLPRCCGDGIYDLATCPGCGKVEVSENLDVPVFQELGN